MQISIVYFSKTGKTRAMAEEIVKGAQTADAVTVKAFGLDEIDKEFLNKSNAVIFGTPTYAANMAWPLKKWLDEANGQGFKLGGKIGAVFATAEYIQGGADTALLSIISHLMVKGMLVYSGGASLGQPFTHLGAVATGQNFDAARPLFNIFGQRIAQKVQQLFPDGV